MDLSSSLIIFTKIITKKMNSIGISFNDEWIKSISKEDFVSYCEMHYPEFAKKDAEGYYSRVTGADAQKSKGKGPANAANSAAK